ncbi:flagellar basal-body MS-ring/collar protein FliF [Lentisalinibacter salinarum]|uniref:flagellar basal-body MS-ring/collar protein FliF n=1 Tax=Lentisalinibacter salinarum TaxID=2992239 RepID=UPI00386D8E6F
MENNPPIENRFAAASHLDFAGVMRIPAVRQVLLLVGVAGSVAIGIALFLWSQSPAYTQLYGDLAERDRSQVVEALRTAGIDFRLDPGTGAVMVPDARVHDARLELAANGLPEGTGMGLEMIKEPQGFGVSQFMENARYQHALETELARTIRNVRSVQEARVHLAMPKQTAFVRDREGASASVMLSLYGGRQLEPEQADAIVHLVASSVPNLMTKDVTLIDQHGRMLSSNGERNGYALTAAQFEHTRTVEQSYRERIVDLLTPLVGAGNVRAQVVADIDFTVKEETRENYDPESTVVRSETVSERQRSGGSDAAQGIPGALSNQPPEAGGVAPQEGEAAAASAVNTSREATRNFEVDKTVSRVIAPTGAIRRLSVAVLIDDVAAAGAAAEGAGDGESAGAASLGEQDIARMTALVKEAVGFDEARGDSVQLINAPFQPAPEVAAPDGPPIWQQPQVLAIGRQVLGALLVLALGFGVLRPMLRGIVQSHQQSTPQLAAAGGAGALGAPAQQHQPQLSYEQKIAAARNITTYDPGRVAQVVKKWVAEDV